MCLTKGPMELGTEASMPLGGAHPRCLGTSHGSVGDIPATAAKICS